MNFPPNPLPRTPLIAPLTYHSGTLRSRRFPLFSQWFSLYACAKAWCPRGGLGALVGAIGFSVMLFFSELLCFPLFWHDFRLIISDFGTPPRGALERYAKSHWFDKIFEDFGRLRRGASSRLAI